MDSEANCFVLFWPWSVQLNTLSELSACTWNVNSFCFVAVATFTSWRANLFRKTWRKSVMPLTRVSTPAPLVGLRYMCQLHSICGVDGALFEPTEVLARTCNEETLLFCQRLHRNCSRSVNAFRLFESSCSGRIDDCMKLSFYVALSCS